MLVSITAKLYDHTNVNAVVKLHTQTFAAIQNNFQPKRVTLQKEQFVQREMAS